MASRFANFGERVLIHLLEETSRHLGHIDILREQLDGEVGR
jgi:hypothetical protein